MDGDRFYAPRALYRRPMLRVRLYPSELHDLIRLIEYRATVAADDPEQIGYAQWLFDRRASLREAVR